MSKIKKIWAIILAAGSGSRLGGKLPKPYLKLDQDTVLTHSFNKLLSHQEIEGAVCVINPAHSDRFTASLLASQGQKPGKEVISATGGQSRQESVRKGLRALAATIIERGENIQNYGVLIHDAARPFVTHKLLCDLLQHLKREQSAIAAMPLFDSLKRCSSDGKIEQGLDRQNLWRAQTPQAFPLQDILSAHNKQQHRGDLTDDAAVAQACGLPVFVLESDDGNSKITTQSDLEKARQRILIQKAGSRPEATRGGIMTQAYETRCGIGYDVHAFEAGEGIILCGHRFPFHKKLKGHSDADVGLHAVTDAIFGALAEGDIGHHFPPSDEEWRAAASDQFLIHACDLVKKRQGRLTHLDVTLICEAPKVGPHRDAMRKAISAITGLSLDRISVKATTTEKLGFAGREEGIAAQAIATLILPADDLA